MFRRGGKCRPCSQCGPDLFESQQCSQFTDTICDWCLNPNTLPEHRLLNNINYHKKCADIIQLQREFHELLEQRNPSENSQIVVIKPIFNDYDRQKSRYIDFPKWSNDNSIKLQMKMELRPHKVNRPKMWPHLCVGAPNHGTTNESNMLSRFCYLHRL